MTTQRRIARRPGGIQRRAGARPRYTWRPVLGAAQDIAPGVTGGYDLAAGGAAPALGSGLGVFGDYTIRRVIGTFAGASRNIGDSLEIDVIHWAIYVAENDALAAIAFPDVGVDVADWLAFGTLFVGLSQQNANAGSDNRPVMTTPLESRSMRKVNNNHQSPVLVVTASSGNTSSIRVMFFLRILVSHGLG